MEIKDWIALFSLATSLIALFVSLRLALQTHHRSIYNTVDKAISDLVSVQLKYPAFRDPAVVDSTLAKAANDTDRLRLEAYIILVYNALETLYDKYGEKQLRGNAFFPAMKALAKRYRKWLYIDDHVKSYNLKMVSFLEAHH
jgi:hypothetical protein